MLGRAHVVLGTDITQNTDAVESFTVGGFGFFSGRTIESKCMGLLFLLPISKHKYIFNYLFIKME